MALEAIKQELSYGDELENKQQVERWIRWFKKDGEELVGETKLVGLTIEQLKQILTPDPEDPLMYYCYPIQTRKQVEFLVPWVKVQLDLETYEYFLECNAVE